ncbi:MAG TPA: cytochrome c [Thermoanaerobaculia bacterium]|nr:cytochrome c [Thermoanaerobaculia bacterium]
MKNVTLALGLTFLIACNRDAVETPQSGKNDQVIPSTTTAEATTTSELVPLGDTAATDTSATAGTTASTVTTHTPATGQTTARTATSEPPPDTAPAPPAVIAAGQAVYRTKCVSCHGVDGKNAIAGVMLASAATQAKSDEALAITLRDAPQHRGLGIQPTQLLPLVAYVKALQ